MASLNSNIINHYVSLLYCQLGNIRLKFYDESLVARQYFSIIINSPHTLGAPYVVALPFFGGMYSYASSLAWLTSIVLSVDKMSMTRGTNRTKNHLHITLRYAFFGLRKRIVR